MLEEQDVGRLKEIFVTRQECTTTTGQLESKYNESNVRLAVIEHQLKNITWLILTVGAAVIATLIKTFFGG